MKHDKIIALKQQLRKNFPEAVKDIQASSRSELPSLQTGLEQLDIQAPPAHGLIELSAPASGCGGLSLLIPALLQNKATAEQPLALIDYRCAWDVKPLGPLSQRLLWMQVKSMDESLKCADWLTLDGNLPLSILNLLRLSNQDQERIRPAVWQRLRQNAEQQGCALIALTRKPFITRANFRRSLQGHFQLEDLQAPSQELYQKFTPNSERIARTG